MLVILCVDTYVEFWNHPRTYGKLKLTWKGARRGEYQIYELRKQPTDDSESRPQR